MKNLIPWPIKGDEPIANYHKKSGVMYLSNQATDKDIEEFTKYLEDKGYENIRVFKP